MERFEWFRFSVPAVPLRRGCCVFQYSLNREDGSGFGSWKTVLAVPVPRSVPAQRALRDRLMSRGKNCLPTVSRQFLTRNYPRPNCLLKCLPNCLSPTREGFLSSFKINPAVRVIARQVRDKNCLAAIFAPRHQSVSSGPLGGKTVPTVPVSRFRFGSWATLQIVPVSLGCGHTGPKPFFGEGSYGTYNTKGPSGTGSSAMRSWNCSENQDWKY